LGSFATEFKDSLHLFEQTLTRDLLGWHCQETTLLQYVDGVFQYRATEPLICRVTESFLKFSGLQGYKDSKEKAQLCLPQITYLGVVLKGQTHSLSNEQIDSILHFLIPHTIKQLRAFLGVTGFCRI
jgi:hypothetical protein